MEAPPKSSPKGRTLESYKMEKKFDNSGSSEPKLWRGWGRLSWLKNKYFLSGTFFIVWMLFFDLKDLPTVYNRWSKLKQLERNEQHMNRENAETHKELDLLRTNAQTIEKYAREKYMMKKDNEDLFIINTPSKTN